ncbi:geranylgeranylglyceryl/heptaprenylglyceryl phosphate synthase [Chitinophaga sedimenti]|uniref:geranylgeranylglyceryl/heptaprenylglyceryl phosphate synthase n=1 Tax=Chitinophaga sedimenti TaxID=2033606 RepID=UPI0027E078D3|nr:geranylgeranylglyceryl/heptaprenylglyceryl phosphate synthase [Chitinophaga sedimenti]
MQLIPRKKAKGLKSFAVLVDPDKVTPDGIAELTAKCTEAKVDYLFLGGSLVITNHLDEVIQQIKATCDIPVVLFPGSPSQVSRYADALLYLSVISGRNAELLIGQHVISAVPVKKAAWK